MAEHLELPRPLRLLRTVAWSLSESMGIPLAASEQHIDINLAHRREPPGSPDPGVGHHDV
jgi:hypothetical protein